jgi:hypothetical protein
LFSALSHGVASLGVGVNSPVNNVLNGTMRP